MYRTLFIDDQAVAMTRGVTRRWHQPEKLPEPVLAATEPWEQGADRLHLWNTPFWDEQQNRWVMLYYGGSELHPLYAVSEDGIAWTKPDLGRIAYQGQGSNIVDLGFSGQGKENRVVFVDLGPAEGERRLQGLTWIRGRLRPMTSADGTQWTLLDHEGPPTHDEYRLGYDWLQQRFVATVKQDGSRPSYQGTYPVPEYGRATAVSLSRDLIHWTEPTFVLAGDELDADKGRARIEDVVSQTGLAEGPIFVNQPEQHWSEIYNMPVFTYEDLYLGLPVMFDVSGSMANPEKENRMYQNGLLYPELAFSRDLLQWHRPEERDPFIPLSRPGSALADQGVIQISQPVIRDDALWFYYSGCSGGHASRLAKYVRPEDSGASGGLFLARLRRDGFVSLAAGEQPGVVLTRPVEITGSQLFVNAAAAAGELRAEIRDAHTGRAIPGYSLGDYYPYRFTPVERERFADAIAAAPDTSVPLREDTLGAALKWQDKEDLAELKGRLVRIQFLLQKADLFSFWFE